MRVNKGSSKKKDKKEKTRKYHSAYDVPLLDLKRLFIGLVALLSVLNILKFLVDEPAKKVRRLRPRIQKSDEPFSNLLAGYQENDSGEGGERAGRLESCVWYPAMNGTSYGNTTCMKTITRRILASYYEKEGLDEHKEAVPPLRWLFFGDSTVARLWMVNSALKKALMSSHKVQNACPSTLMCYNRQHERCQLNEAFLFPPILENPASWRAPNLTVGEGPCAFGLKKANCQDCSGCKSNYAVCHRKRHASEQHENCVLNTPPTTVTVTTNNANSTSTASSVPKMYGGYFSVEFARDVEIQTPDYGTTQENLAAFVQKSYNADPWLLERFGGHPICVVNAGMHDMSIPDITLAKHLVNVEWYLRLLLGPCGHIVLLQNTAPIRKNDQDSQWFNVPQTQVKVREWNKAVHDHLSNNASQTLPLQRFTILDVFEASIDQPHENGDNNIHLKKFWYDALGSFFVELVYRISSSKVSRSPSQIE